MAARTMSLSWADTGRSPVALPQKLTAGVDAAAARAVTFIGPFCLGAIAWEIVQCDVAPMLAFLRDFVIWLAYKVFRKDEKRARSSSNGTNVTSATASTQPSQMMSVSSSNAIEEYKQASETQGPFAFYFRLTVHLLAFAARVSTVALLGVYLAFVRGDASMHCQSWAYAIVAMGAAAQMLITTAVLLRSIAILHNAAMPAIICVCVAWTVSTALLFAGIPAWQATSQADGVCQLHVERYLIIHFLAPAVFVSCLPLLFVPRGVSHKLKEAGWTVNNVKMWLGKRIRTMSSDSSRRQKPTDPNILRSKLAEASFLSTQERGLAFVRTDDHASTRPMTAAEQEHNRSMARWHNREINARSSPSPDGDRIGLIRIAARKSTIFAAWSGWWFLISLTSALGGAIAVLSLSSILLFAVYPIVVTLNVLSCRQTLDTPPQTFAQTASDTRSRSASQPQRPASLINTSSISSLAPPRQPHGSVQMHKSSKDGLGNANFGKRVIHKISDCSLPEKFVNFVTIDSKPIAKATTTSRLAHRRSRSDYTGINPTGYYVIGPTQFSDDKSRPDSDTLANLLSAGRRDENRDSGNTQMSNNRSSGGTQKSRNSAPYGASTWSSSQEYIRITPPYKDRKRTEGDTDNQYTTALSPGPRSKSKRAIGMSSTDELRNSANSKDSERRRDSNRSENDQRRSSDAVSASEIALPQPPTMQQLLALSTRPRGDSASTNVDSLMSQQTTGTFGFRNSSGDGGSRAETRPRNGTFTSTLLTSHDVQEENDSMLDGHKPKIVELTSPGHQSMQADISGGQVSTLNSDDSVAEVMSGSLTALKAAHDHEETGHMAEVPSQDALRTNLAPTPQSVASPRSPGETDATYEDARSTPFGELEAMARDHSRSSARPLSDPVTTSRNEVHADDKNRLHVERHRSLALGTDIESIDGVTLSQYMDERGFPKGADESDDEEPSLAAALESVDRATSLRRLSLEPHQTNGHHHATPSEVDGSRSDDIYSEYSRQSPSYEMGSEASFGMRDISGNPRLRNIINSAVSSPLDNRSLSGTAPKRRSFRSGSGSRLDPAQVAMAPQMPLPRTPSDGSAQNTDSASRSPATSSLRTTDSSDYRPGYASRRGTASRISLGDTSRHGSFQTRLSRANSGSNLSVPSPLYQVMDSVKVERRSSPLSNKVVNSVEYQTAHLPDTSKSAETITSGSTGVNRNTALATLSSKLSQVSQRRSSLGSSSRSHKGSARTAASPVGRPSFDGADYALSDMLQSSSKGKAGRGRGPSAIQEQQQQGQSSTEAPPMLAPPRREPKEDDELTSPGNSEVDLKSPFEEPNDLIDNESRRTSGLKEAGWPEL